MTKIQNTPKTVQGEKVQDLRAAIEHRATWMALLLDEARKRGTEWEEIGRAAIKKCGCFHGANIDSKMQNQNDMQEFTEHFLTDNVRNIFEMDVKSLTDEELKIEFNYCPLVAAWEKQGFQGEDLVTLCDIAMDGDRGIASQFNEFEFQLGKTIAKGDHICEVNFFRNTK